MKIEAASKLLFIGDSITDCGRAQPGGEGLFDALGKGYVAQVDALIGVTYASRQIRVVNQGLGGNTVRDLKARWERDVLDRRPDWLVVMIGINDVWRQFDSPRQRENHVLLEEYESTLRELVERTRAAVSGMVLMSPFYIEPNRQDAMRSAMDRYGEAVKTVASQCQAIFVDVQVAFDQLLEHYYPASLAWDRVHPTQAGHMAITRAFLDSIDFRWDGK